MRHDKQATLSKLDLVGERGNEPRHSPPCLRTRNTRVNAVLCLWHQVIAKKSTDLTVGEGKDLARRADMCINEIYDSALLGEGCLPALRHALSDLLVSRRTFATLVIHATAEGEANAAIWTGAVVSLGLATELRIRCTQDWKLLRSRNSPAFQAPMFKSDVDRCYSHLLSFCWPPSRLMDAPVLPPPSLTGQQASHSSCGCRSLRCADLELVPSLPPRLVDGGVQQGRSRSSQSTRGGLRWREESASSSRRRGGGCCASEVCTTPKSRNQ